MSINKKRVRLLVDALRSDEYKRGRGYLEYHDNGTIRHCCLGVACRVAMKNGLSVEAVTYEFSGSTFFDGDPVLLPEKVKKWYGFSSTNPKLLIDVGAKLPKLIADSGIAATIANDSLDLDFNSIADAFEATYMDQP